MPKEANVGIKISTGQAQADLKQLSATILSAAQAFEQANRTATQQETVLRQLSADMKRATGATNELKAATLQEKQAKIDSLNALTRSRDALAANREETVRLTAAKAALASQELRNKQSTDALTQSKIASTNALKQQRLAQASLIQSRVDLLAQNNKLINSTSSTIDKFKQLKSVLATFAVVAGIRAAVGTLTDFEYTMKRLGFITKATDSEFQALNDTARELGAATQYTASDAAKGMQYLGLVGLKTQQVIATIPSVLNLATSASIDMGTAADITAKAMTAFNIQAEDANRISDVFIQTMTRSNTNIEQLGNAFKFVGPIANSAGLSLEDAASAVGAISDAGIQASIAGTGLRRAIQALLNPTVKAEKALRILGLSVDDVSTKYNSLEEIVAKFQKAGLGELPELSFDIFGLRGAPVIQALISNIDKFNELKDSYASTIGIAKEGADVLDNTLRAAFKRLTSVVQELVLAGGDNGLLWVLRGLIENSASALRLLGGMGSEAEKASVGINALAFGFKMLTATAVLSGLSKMVKLLGLLSVASKGAAAFNPIALIGFSIAALSPVITEATKSIVGFFSAQDEYMDKTDDIRRSTLEGADAFEVLASSLDGVVFSGDLSGIDALSSKLGEVADAAINAQQGLSEPIGDSWMAQLAEELEDATTASKELEEKQASLERMSRSRNYGLRKIQLLAEYTSAAKDEAGYLAEASTFGATSIVNLTEEMLESAKAADTWGTSYKDAGAEFTTFAGRVSAAYGWIKTAITGAPNTEDEIAARQMVKTIDELRLKYDESYASSEQLAEIDRKRAETLRTMEPLIKAGLMTESDLDEANRVFDLWVKNVTSKSTSASDKTAERLARDRERITDTLMKTILPEHELDYRKIMENIAEAQRVGVEAQTIATYKRIALQDLEEERLRDFVDAYEEEIKLQEKAGVITKEMAVEALQALMPSLSNTSKEYLDLAKAIETYNASISKDVEREKKRQLDALQEAIDVVGKEFDVGKFEVLSDEDMALQRDMLQELLTWAEKLPSDIDGAAEAVARLRKEMEEIPDETNKAKEASREWLLSFESGITKAIMGAESLGDAFANLANQIAEYMINMALWGASGEGGLLGGVLGGLFGRASGGPVNKNQPYIVGEKRPEIFVPNTAGRIEPSVPSGSYAPVITVNVNVETRGDMNEEEANKMGKMVSDIIEIKQAEFMRKQQRSGGALKAAYSGVVL